MKITETPRHGCNVLLYIKDKYLITHRADGKGIVYPGGGVDPFEKVDSAAARESLEELGILISKDQMELIAVLNQRVPRLRDHGYLFCFVGHDFSIDVNGKGILSLKEILINHGDNYERFLVDNINPDPREVSKIELLTFDQILQVRDDFMIAYLRMTILHQKWLRTSRKVHFGALADPILFDGDIY